jgi:hypothetical protein
MASKKLKKALGAALVGFGASKVLGSMGAAKKAAQVDTGDFGNQMDNDTNLVKGTAKSLLKKSKSVKNMVPKKKPGSGSSGISYGDAFGLGPMDGAKYGKMIKAKNGVMARGCKLGKNKRTIIT